jgi:hypothetical protein
MTILALLPLIAAQSAAPNAVTAEQALETYKIEFKLPDPRCASDRDPEAIVVCARRDPDDSGPKALRIPYVPEPGRRIPGEVSFDGGGCMRLCYQPVQVDVFKVGKAVVKGVKYLLED